MLEAEMEWNKLNSIFIQTLLIIGGLQPILRDPKGNDVAAMLDDTTFCFVIQHGRHAMVFSDLQGLVANHPFTGGHYHMASLSTFLTVGQLPLSGSSFHRLAPIQNGYTQSPAGGITSHWMASIPTNLTGL